MAVMAKTGTGVPCPYLGIQSELVAADWWRVGLKIGAD